MSELKAIIFDVDGTLADTERHGHRVAFNEAFAAAGLDWVWDEDLYGKLLKITGGKERIKFYLDSYKPDFKYDGDFIVGLHKAKTASYLNMLKQGKIPLRFGVKQLINEARAAGIVIAIATTTTFENVTFLLENQLGQDAINWFAVLAAGDIVPHKKPAPDIYFYALDKLAVPAQNCIAIEDSRNGLLSSLGAGLATVITTNGYTKDEDFNGAKLVVSEISNTAGETFLSLDILRNLLA